MKIKEVETLTGMSRDNIRFYERAGLLEITRHDNGYRDYDDEDIKTLKRIKLLRSLNIPLEDIKSIQLNKINLSSYLNEHVKQLENNQHHLEKMTKLCHQLISDDVKYIDLENDTYMYYFDSVYLNEDINHTLNAPIRRYFARAIDYAFYSLLVTFTMVVLLRMNIHHELMTLFTTILSLICMILIEPWFISKFKTTPGKWIIGLYVTDYKGNQLSYWDAVTRTLNVVVYGYGCMFPIVSTLLGVYCFYACSKGKTFIWENGNIQILKDNKKSRYFLLTLVFVLQHFVTFGLSNYSLFPKNRGNITIDEFVENVNYLNVVYYDENEYTLLNDGTWESRLPTHVSTTEPYSNFYFTEENGELKEVTFILKYEDGFSIIQREYLTKLAISSFMKAQKSYTPYHLDEEIILSKTNNNFKYNAHGLTVKANYVYDDTAEAKPYTDWTYTFTITKEK